MNERFMIYELEVENKPNMNAGLRTKKKIYLDIVSYLLLSLVVLFGLVIYLAFRYKPLWQFVVVVAVVVSYLGWGLVYHHLKRDLTLKIYLEYLLIASIVLAASVFVYLR